MRKTIRICLILMLALALLAPSARAASAAEALIYQSDFSAGTDGWVARSTGSASVSARDGVLTIRGRESDWHSPGRNFDLVPGARYRISVSVLQEELDSTPMMISVAHTSEGGETYENLARADVPRGKWTTLACEWTPGVFDAYVLYVETVSAPTLSFSIRDFTVAAPDGQPEARVTEPPMVLEAVENLPSLKEEYADFFDVGCCVNQMQVRNAKMMDLVTRQYSIITPENELKPDSVLDVPASRRLAETDETAVAVRFDAAAPILNFARDHGLKLHGHVLFWHSQTPEALFHEGYDVSKPWAGREIMLGRMENYVRCVMEYMAEHYPGLIVSWDVVNEAVDDGSGALRSSPWLKTVGDDYLLRAFELARKYAPEGTLLYYNDYNTAYLPKQDGIVRLLESLIAEGNIDGYGFQMHHSVSGPSASQISASVERIAALGLRLRVSELDVGTSGNSETAFRKQAKVYADVMRELLFHADQFEAVQVWGISDQTSWRASQYPLLFDGALRPKPAFWAMLDPSSAD